MSTVRLQTIPPYYKTKTEVYGNKKGSRYFSSFTHKKIDLQYKRMHMQNFL